MKYYLAKFFRYVPQISGMQAITGVDNFAIIKVSTDQALTELQAHPDNIPLVELTEIEATEACKFYGETRGYRKAYSDVEGLVPDADELANGKRKTKVYITPIQEQAVISLMKKAFKLHIEEEMKDRKTGKPELTGKARKQYDKNIHAALLEKLDTLNTIDDIVEAREQVLGIEMSKDLATRKGLWDAQKNTRKGKIQYGVRF